MLMNFRSTDRHLVNAEDTAVLLLLFSKIKSSCLERPGKLEFMSKRKGKALIVSVGFWKCDWRCGDFKRF